MDYEKALTYITGENGGVFALGMMIGGTLAMRYIAPRVYGPKIIALEESLAAIELELETFRKWRNELVEKNLNRD